MSNDPLSLAPGTGDLDFACIARAAAAIKIN
jgi:hypothetical protein